MEPEMRRYRDTRYLVTNDGRIYSEITKKWMKPSLTKHGYYRIHPHINGKHTNLFINRMVAEVFIPNPENKPFVLHNDNNPLNNNVNNLRWGTQSENIQQAYDEKRISRKGELNGQSKLTSVYVNIIKEARSNGFMVKEIAAYFDMGAGWIGRVSNGYHWNHL